MAKSEEKQMFSQAIGGQVRCIMGDVQVAYERQFFSLQAPVVQKLDSAIHRINHYPKDKC